MKKIITCSLILFFTVLAVFSKPINNDAAWNYLNINNHILNGKYMDVVLKTVVYHLKLFDKFYSLIFSSPITNYAIFRITSIFFILSATFFIYKFAETYFKNQKMGLISALLYLFFSTSGISAGIVLRGEFIYSSLATMLFSGIYLSFVNSGKKSIFYALIPILLTPIAFSAHPVGLILYPSVMLFICMYKNFNLKLKIKLFVLYSLFYGILFYFISIYPNSFNEIITGIKSLSKTRFHFWQEYQRYISLISLGKEQLFFIVCSLSGLFLYFFKNKKEKSSNAMWKNYSHIVFFSTLIFFIFLTSKTMAYFSVLYFFFVFGILFLLYRYAFNDQALNCTTVFCCIILMTSLWSSFFKNEDFMRLLHIPNYRVDRILKIEKEINGKNILAPLTFHLMVKNNNATFYPLERITILGENFDNSSEFDFLIFPTSLSSKNLKKNMNLAGLKFIKFFKYQGDEYILYDTN